MFISDLFIKRPVLAGVASSLIVVIGLVSLFGLPVREFPSIDASVVTVTTTYRGAAPEIIDTEITEVVEGAVAQVDGVKRITSSSREGRGRTVVEFETSRGIDEAAADVREVVSRIAGQLPDGADRPVVVKADSDAQPVMRVSLMSDRLSPPELTDLAERVVVDRLSTVDGVGEVQIGGQRRYAIRIWLDRRAMAARNLTVEDVEAALRRNNLELPSGRLESTTRQLTVRTDSRLSEVEDFRALTVAQVGGYPIRLGEIADVQLGIEDDSSIVRVNGRNAIGLNVVRQAKANTIAVSDGIRAQMEAVRPLLPEGVMLEVSTDDATFIRASIEEVVKALLLAVLLVVLVIFAFLYSVRATLVPALTIPVAVIGTFAMMAALGFSINVLTLLALILAIGLVVDDAIVVLENVQRRVDEGEPPLVAAYLGARQVTFAVLATSAVLIAVFVPISMIGGDIGRLFTEFGLALAGAVVLSTFVALTLAPMLCSKVLGRAAGGPGRVGALIERGLRGLTAGYRALLRRALAMPLVVLAVAALVSLAGVQLYAVLPNELTPSEDRGGFFVPGTAPPGATIAFTDAGARRVEEALQPLLESGEAFRIVAGVGWGNQPNRAFVIVGLNDWSERARSQQEIVQAVRPAVGAIPDLRAFPINRAGLGQRGNSQGVQFVIGGPDYESVLRWSEAIVARAERNPNLADVDTDFEATRPLLTVEIDRRKADDLGVPVERIAGSLQTMLASREVTTYVDRGREYAVIVQAQDADRRTPSDLESIFVRADRGGELVPLSALVTLSESASAPDLRRFDRLPSITVQASLVGDYDLGSAIEFFQNVAAEELPVEARAGFDGAAQRFLETSGSLYFTFAGALLIVFLVLAAQFESVVHPFIILLTVPLGIMGVLLSLVLTGGSLNIYSQIGAILLIGLMAKNGILIVEFANQLRDQGLSVREAIVEGASLRLRPILMTVVSTILGATPLALASGAGAESRVAIGTVVIGGLAVSTVLTLFLTPVLYDLLARFARPTNAVQAELARALAERRQRDLVERQPAE